MLTQEEQKRLAEWLIRIGKERAIAWRAVVKLRNEDPFTNMLWKAFLSTGLGDSFASAKLEEIKYRARRAESVFDFLNRRYEEGRLEELLEELGPQFSGGIGTRMKRCVRALLELERGFGVRMGPIDKATMNELYERLREGNIPGIGKKLAHHIIYDLIRLYDFPVPDELSPHEDLIRKLQRLGITKPENIFKPEDWPYVDAAVWDLRLE